jgi:MFS family permease
MSVPDPPRATGSFRALRHRDFRIFWASLVASAVGTWMQIVAQALLVLKISNGSALALGAVSLAQALAFLLFALFGGAVADRVDKRRLLLLTQSLCMVFALTLGVLTALHVVAVWMVVLLAFLNGAALSFDQPTRAALVSELVPPEDLLAAVSLQSIVFTGAGAIGPALAGVAVTVIGYAGNFFVNAASYVGVLVALLAIAPRKAATPTPARTPSFGAVREALLTVREDAALPGLLVLVGSLLFFGPSLALLLPVMATEVLHVDEARVGALFAASGVGTVIGGLALARLRDPARKGLIVLGAALGWCVALATFARTGSFVPALGALLILGVCQVGVSAPCIALLQTRVPAAMRGRVMSLNTLLVMGARPLGDFVASAVIAAIGASRTALASAAVVGLVALVVASREGVRGA